MSNPKSGAEARICSSASSVGAARGPKANSRSVSVDLSCIPRRMDCNCTFEK